MFIALYSWRIKPGKEAQFIQASTEITDYFLKNWDSLGTRLHRGDDGVFYAYAQWKSAEHREKAFENAFELEASAKMTEAIDERLEPIILEMLSDLLVFPEK